MARKYADLAKNMTHIRLQAYFEQAPAPSPLRMIVTELDHPEGPWIRHIVEGHPARVIRSFNNTRAAHSGLGWAVHFEAAPER